MGGLTVTQPFKWQTALYANGELLAIGKLTDAQIKQVAKLIIKLGGELA